MGYCEWTDLVRKYGLNEKSYRLIQNILDRLYAEDLGDEILSDCFPGDLWWYMCEGVITQRR